MTFKCVSTFAALAILALPAHAGLIGTSVTGSVQFGVSVPNFFDPANGAVPSGNGYLNAADQFNSPTVTISGSAVEFGFQSVSNTDTANFSDTGLTITDVSTIGSTFAVYTFVDDAFIGLTLNKLTDSFASSVSFSLVGNTLTVSTPIFSGPPTSTATFSLVAAGVPEPQSAGLIAAGLALLAYGARRGVARKQ